MDQQDNMQQANPQPELQEAATPITVTAAIEQLKTTFFDLLNHSQETGGKRKTTVELLVKAFNPQEAAAILKQLKHDAMVDLFGKNEKKWPSRRDDDSGKVNALQTFIAELKVQYGCSVFCGQYAHAAEARKKLSEKGIDWNGTKLEYKEALRKQEKLAAQAAAVAASTGQSLTDILSNKEQADRIAADIAAAELTKARAGFADAAKALITGLRKRYHGQDAIVAEYLTFVVDLHAETVKLDQIEKDQANSERLRREEQENKEKTIATMITAAIENNQASDTMLAAVQQAVNQDAQAAA